MGFPVKSSFFGAVDTAGFPKDLYHLFRSQWTTEPMVHLLPMNWTGHRPGEPVSVWAYSNADTVELYLNGAKADLDAGYGANTSCGTTSCSSIPPSGSFQ